MDINRIIMLAMAFGAVLGGLDYMLGNRFGFGAKFEEGFQCLGPTAFSMVGILCLVPPFARLLGPMVAPVFQAIGADPAMFGSLLAIDMGGYPLAMELAEDVRLGLFSGLIVSAMLGVTIVFIIPVGLGIIEPNDREYFAKGLLIGLIPIPAGALVGGVMMRLDAAVILVNLVPCILIGCVMVLGIRFAQQKAIRIFLAFGRLITVITVAGLTAGAVEYMTGIVIIPGMPSIMEGMATASGIAVVLLGSLPLMELILRILDKPFQAAGRRFGLDGASVAGLLFCCVSVLPVYRSLKEMCPKGKVMVTAASVSLISVFAAHLGFTAQADPQMLTPMIVSKLVSGGLAVVLAYVVTDGQRKGQINT
ncbi:MAG: ethanolamine utilization protein EutH [Lachnospiraceae bacterium]|nr:ethanolamine utilization protein EutH [Lachnospiraceae bacterium]